MDNNRKERYEVLIAALNQGLFERSEAVKKAILATLAGESIFFLGPPGVAKSLIARRLKFAFKDATSFEYLMNRFSTPEEIFGPISIKLLKEEDKLERKVEHYLPSANIAFLDEIWKAGPSIQNTLLTIINEKIFRNGSQTIKVPLIGLIAASNELPASGQGLEALWDRFIIRLRVDNIVKSSSFNQMITQTGDLTADTIDDSLKIAINDIDTIRSKISVVSVPDEVLNVINKIKLNLVNYNQNLDSNDEMIYVSDRRWKKIIKILRTSAYINGRDFVDLMDCYLIEDMIWPHPDLISKIRRYIQDALTDFSYNVSTDTSGIYTELDEIQNEVMKEIYVKQQSRELVYQGKQSITTFYYDVEIDQRSSNYRRSNPWNRVKYVTFDGNNTFEDMSQGFTATFYDDAQNRLNNIQIQEIQHSNDSFKCGNIYFNLKTNTKDKIEFLTRRPHDLIIDTWNNRIETTKSEIQKILNQIDEKEEVEFSHLKSNLFVPPKKADLILQNLENARKRYKKLSLSIDELKHQYQNIEEGKLYDEEKAKNKFIIFDPEQIVDELEFTDNIDLDYIIDDFDEEDY